MVNFNFESKQATPEWLTSVLSRNGFLSNGEVASLEQTTPEFAAKSFIADFISLDVTYSPGSQGAKPSKIVLKAIKPKMVASEAHRELKFYNAISDVQTELPFLTCFGTAVCPETNRYCLLLEDLTATHHQSPAPLPPHQKECEAAIDVLTSIHAYFWDYPRIGDTVFARPSEDGVNKHFQVHEEFYKKFVDYLGDRISGKRKKTYQLVFEKMPEIMWDRLSHHEKLTVTHGDAHFRNFLYPNNKQNNQCVIFDWQSWGIGRVGRDLSYMIAFQWFPERRQRLEMPLLEHYLNELSKYEIFCSWEDLLIEYRISVIMNLLLPVQWYYFDYSPRIWWHYFERAFASFEDLDCVEFL